MREDAEPPLQDVRGDGHKVQEGRRLQGGTEVPPIPLSQRRGKEVLRCPLQLQGMILL